MVKRVLTHFNQSESFFNIGFHYLRGQTQPCLQIIRELERINYAPCTFQNPAEELTKAVDNRKMASKFRAEVKVISLLFRATFLIST